MIGILIDLFLFCGDCTRFWGGGMSSSSPPCAACSVAKMLNRVSPEHRKGVADSLAHQADMRLIDPVYGCVGEILELKEEIRQRRKILELLKLHEEIRQKGEIFQKETEEEIRQEGEILQVQVRLREILGVQAKLLKEIEEEIRRKSEILEVQEGIRQKRQSVLAPAADAAADRAATGPRAATHAAGVSLGPCSDADEPTTTASDADEPRVWGGEMSSSSPPCAACSVAKMLNKVSLEHQKDVADSLAHQADMRLIDPVYGCLGEILELKEEIKQRREILEPKEEIRQRREILELLKLHEEIRQKGEIFQKEIDEEIRQKGEILEVQVRLREILGVQAKLLKEIEEEIRQKSEILEVQEGIRQKRQSVLAPAADAAADRAATAPLAATHAVGISLGPCSDADEPTTTASNADEPRQKGERDLPEQK